MRQRKVETIKINTYYYFILLENLSFTPLTRNGLNIFFGCSNTCRLFDSGVVGSPRGLSPPFPLPLPPYRPTKPSPPFRSLVATRFTVGHRSVHRMRKRDALFSRKAFDKSGCVSLRGLLLCRHSIYIFITKTFLIHISK